MRRFIRSPSRASRTKPSRRCIACGPPGWQPEPRGSTRIRGLLREFGLFIPVGAAPRRAAGPRRCWREPTTVPMLLHTTLAAACDEIDVLEANMRAVERQLATLASDMADVTLLQTVPGRRPASPPPPWSRWWPTSGGFHRGGTSRAFWD